MLNISTLICLHWVWFRLDIFGRFFPPIQLSPGRDTLLVCPMKVCFRVNETAQQVKAVVIKPDNNLSVSPVTHMVDGKKGLTKAAL